MFFLVHHQDKNYYNLDILEPLAFNLISIEHSLERLSLLDFRDSSSIGGISLYKYSFSKIELRSIISNCATIITTSKSKLLELIFIFSNLTNQDYILLFDGYKFTIKPYDPDLAHKLISYYLNKPLATRNITPEGTYYNSNQKHMELLFTILEGMPTLKDNLAAITLAATTGNIKKGFVIKDEVGIQIVQQGYLSLFNLHYYNLYQFEYRALMSLIYTWLKLPNVNNIPNLEIIKADGYLSVHNLDKWHLTDLLKFRKLL